MSSDSSPQLHKQPDRRSIVLRIAGTIISLGLLIYLLVHEGWQTIQDAVLMISLPYFLLALGLTFISRLAVALRWYNLLHSANIDISIWKTIQLVFAGLFASNFLPTTIGGDVVRFAGAVRLKVDAAVAAASLVMDRLIGMAGMAVVLPIGMVDLFTMPFPNLPMSMNGRSAWAFTFVGFLKKIKYGIKKLLQSAWKATQLWMSNPRSLLISFGFTFVHMIMLFLTLLLFFGRMGETISFWQIAGLWSMSYFITQLPVSINGYGLQELSLIVIFSHYGGISSQNIMALALLIRVLQMMASLPGVFFMTGLIQPANKAADTGE